MNVGRMFSVLFIGWGKRSLISRRSGVVRRGLWTVVLCLVAASILLRQAAASEFLVCLREAVVLQWTPSPHLDVCGYRVFRATTPGGPYTEVSSCLLTVSRFVDDMVSNGETYVYVVTVRDFAGNESLPSPQYESQPVRIQLVSDGTASVDTDLDGLDDNEETSLGTDPWLADSDGDGLGDGDEVFIYGTDPMAVDSDGDGVEDGTEIDDGTDPMDETELRERCDVNRDGLLDAVDIQMTIVQSLLDATDIPGDCDVDGDEYVGAIDIQLVVNAVLGL